MEPAKSYYERRSKSQEQLNLLNTMTTTATRKGKIPKISSIEELPPTETEIAKKTESIEDQSTVGSNKEKTRFFRKILTSKRKKNFQPSGGVIRKQKQKLTISTSSFGIPCSTNPSEIDNERINNNTIGQEENTPVPALQEKPITVLSGAKLRTPRQKVHLEIPNPTQQSVKIVKNESRHKITKKSPEVHYHHEISREREKETEEKVAFPPASKKRHHEKVKPVVSLRNRNEQTIESILKEQEKIILDKAALILYEDEKAKDKLKATVADLGRTCEKYRQDLKISEERSAKQILKLQFENESLLVELSRTNDSLSHWKSKCKKQENDVVNLSKLKLVTKENEALKEDLEVLKSVTRRLNQEMAFYREKLRVKYGTEGKNVPNFLSDSNTNSTSPVSIVVGGEDESVAQNNYKINEPKKNLLPLLVAYDETIAEKNELVKDLELGLERFKAKCQEIVQENEELHKIIGESRAKGSISINEWQFLHENAVTVLEENDLLHDQIKILKNKSEILVKDHEDKVAKLQSKITLMEEEAVRWKANMKDVQDRCTHLTRQISSMTQAIQQRIPIEEHDASIRELKQLFEELKRNYTEETNAITEKLQAVLTEKDRLGNEVTDLDSENAKLIANVKSLEEAQCVRTAELKSLQTELDDANKIRQVTAETVNEMMELAKTAFSERESIQIAFHEQKTLNDQLMGLRKKESELVEELRDKIKLMENVHQEEMEKYRDHISKLEEVLESVGERHQADLVQMKDLIREKTAHIEKLGIEKEQLVEDIETVWKATTRDANSLSQSVQNILRKKIQAPNSQFSHAKEK